MKKKVDPIDKIISEMATTDGLQEKSIKKPIRFLTYNFFLWPPPVYSNAGDFKDDRLSYFIDHYLDCYDVIAF